MLMLQLAVHAQPSEFLNPAYLNSTLQKAVSLSVHSSDPHTQNVGFMLKPMAKPLAKNGTVHYTPSVVNFVCYSSLRGTDPLSWCSYHH